MTGFTFFGFGSVYRGAFDAAYPFAKRGVADDRNEFLDFGPEQDSRIPRAWIRGGKGWVFESAGGFGLAVVPWITQNALRKMRSKVRRKS